MGECLILKICRQCFLHLTLLDKIDYVNVEKKHEGGGGGGCPPMPKGVMGVMDSYY